MKHEGCGVVGWGGVWWGGGGGAGVPIMHTEETRGQSWVYRLHESLEPKEAERKVGARGRQVSP